MKGESQETMMISLHAKTCYRLSLFPIIGEKTNKLIDEKGFNLGVFDDLDEINVEEYEREYGPLNINSKEMNTSFTWESDKWPWEGRNV